MNFLLKISKLKFKLFLLSVTILCSFSCTRLNQNETEKSFSRNDFPNVLNIKNMPEKPVDWRTFCFSDKGSWFGFALPDKNKPGFESSFIGPFLMTEGKWVGKSIAGINFLDPELNKINPDSCKYIYYPGKLVEKISYKDFTVKMSLLFISSDKALINLEIKGLKKVNIIPEWFGSIFGTEGKIITDNKSNPTIQLNNKPAINILFNTDTNSKLSGTDTSYSCKLSPLSISKNTIKTLTSVISYKDADIKNQTGQELITDALINPVKYLDLNKKRWNHYLNKVLPTQAPWGDKKEYQHIAVKAIETLINNWRAAYGDLLHDGLFPSYAVNYFNGFWAWDSWKHSVALALFEPETAKNQIRAMFDYQNNEGMIADCIYADSTENNWLNTKPPLSGWAIWKVFEQTNDTAFLREMYPKLLKYHEWWYKHRDHNKNMLCEYGSADGSLVAAKWESGMDNAIRFDNSKMIKTDDGNYTFNQESVDLNSYLYFEKEFIVKIANTLNDTITGNRISTEAVKLKEKIRNSMFNSADGYFHDITLNGEFINVSGPEGWIPLFTDIASKKQAESVTQTMFDKTKFATYIPFPTASVSEPEFSEGYWRGPIWLDQVYFAIEGVRNYGYNKEANKFTLQVFDRLAGLKEDAPIRENYWPLSGEGMRVNHFCWSAAHLLLLYKQ